MSKINYFKVLLLYKMMIYDVRWVFTCHDLIEY
jgi:hypothetical protein